MKMYSVQEHHGQVHVACIETHPQSTTITSKTFSTEEEARAWAEEWKANNPGPQSVPSQPFAEVEDA